MASTKNALLEKVRQKLKGLQESTTKTAGTWKPSGEHTIRIVPYQHAENQFPFIELYFHYGINGKNYLSPKSFGKPDPFEEFADRLASTGSKEDFNLSRKLRAKLRIYAPILVRGEEKEGIKFWGFGKNMYEDILKLMSDEEWGDITDPENGTDLVINYQSPEDAGNNYGKTSISPKRKTSPLASSEDLKNKYLNQQREITDIYKPLEYDDLKKALEEWLENPNTDTNEEEEDTKTQEKTVETSEENTEEENNSSVKDAKDAFDKLFNKNKKNKYGKEN